MSKYCCYIVVLTLLLLLCFDGISQQMRPVEVNGKWGYLGQDNNWVIKPKFEMAKPFSEGMAPIKIKGKWGFLGENGKIQIKPIFLNVSNFSEGLAAVEILAQKGSLIGSLWGYINVSGQFIIAPKYSKAEAFKNQKAIVVEPHFAPKVQTIINEKGETISPPFKKRFYVKDTVFKIINTLPTSNDSVYAFVNEKGVFLTPYYLNNFEYGGSHQIVSLPSNKNNTAIPDDVFLGNIKLKLYAFLDQNGTIISDWYEEIEPYREGFAPVKKGNKVGFINSKYEMVCEPKYIAVRYLGLKRYGALLPDDSFVLTDEKGTQLSPNMMRFDYFYDNRFLAYVTLILEDKKCIKKALFDKNGQQKSQWFVEIFPSSNFITRGYDYMDYTLKGKPTQTGLWYNYFNDTCVEMLTTWRLNHVIRWAAKTNESNNLDSVLSYFHAPGINYPIDEGFFKNIFYLEFEIHESSSELQFSGGDFHDGMALVSEHKEGYSSLHTNAVNFEMPNVKFGFIDWNGKQTTSCVFDYISGCSDGKAIIRELIKNPDGSTKALFGAVNYQGKTIIKPQFDLMGNFGNGLAPVYSNSKKKWGFVYANGKIAIDYEYEDIRPFRYGLAPVKLNGKWGLIDLQKKVVLDFEYKKAPIPKSKNSIEVLQDGIGYEIISI